MTWGSNLSKLEVQSSPQYVTNRRRLPHIIILDYQVSICSLITPATAVSKTKDRADTSVWWKLPISIFFIIYYVQSAIINKVCKNKVIRVRTEIGNQNSRTFPGHFKHYLHFFQESFFMDRNLPNTAYTQDFCPIQDGKRICLSSSLFLPDFSVAYCLRTLLSFLPFPIPALQGFTSGCI